MNAVLKLLSVRSFHLGYRKHFLCTSRCLLSRGLQEIRILERECRLHDVPSGYAIASLPANYMCKRNYGSKMPKKDGKEKKGGKPKVVLSDEEINSVIDIEAIREKLAKRVDKLKADYLKHVTVRTSLGSLDAMIIKYDGKDYPLNQLAQVTRKNQNLFVLNMVAVPQAIRSVLDALEKSGMGLNPQQDGTKVYLPIPPVTREYRETLVKSAKALAMKTKDELRDIQNQAIKVVRNKKEHFSEDLIYNVQQQIVFVTDTFITQAEAVFTKKQTDLMEGR